MVPYRPGWTPTRPHLGKLSVGTGILRDSKSSVDVSLLASSGSTTKVPRTWVEWTRTRPAVRGYKVDKRKKTLSETSNREEWV